MALAHSAFFSVRSLHLFSHISLLFLFLQNFYHTVDLTALKKLSLCLTEHSSRRWLHCTTTSPFWSTPTRCERIQEHRKAQHPVVALHGHWEYRAVGAWLTLSKLFLPRILWAH